MTALFSSVHYPMLNILPHVINGTMYEAQIMHNNMVLHLLWLIFYITHLNTIILSVFIDGCSCVNYHKRTLYL